MFISAQAAFPFGHGLAFTTFEYSAAQEVPGCAAAACVSVVVKNVGKLPGQELVQDSELIPSLALSKVNIVNMILI